MLCAIAVNKGRLQWTTSIAEGLPEIASKIRQEYRSATLEQLLAHAARIPSYTLPDPQQVAQMKSLAGTHPQQRLAFLETVLSIEPPNLNTGDGAYSNAGYTVAAALLEHATGSSWEDHIQNDLAKALKMKNFGFGYPATEEVRDQPRGHSQEGGKVVVLPLDESRELPICLWPAGAVNCSIGDLAAYTADQLNGLCGRSALLPGTMYKRLHSTLDGKPGFTLGSGIRQDERWGTVHFGAGSGGWFFVRILILPEHDAAVVSASNTGLDADATRELSNDLLQHFVEV
jgi:CubicO group peptidase (beta-lactamase class C family)